MSFITRCPACATAFKVVPDQLKISDGWVRCGHCHQVFDATLDLQPWWPGQTVPDDVSPPVASPPSEPSPPEPFPSEFAQPEPLQPRPAVDSAQMPVTEAATLSPMEPLAATLAATQEPEPEPEPSPDFQPTLVIEPGVEPETQIEPTLGPEPEPEPEPELQRSPVLIPPNTQPVSDRELSFIRQAERRAFWRKPVIRWSLACLMLLLMGLLVLQIMLDRRDLIARDYPTARPALEAMCTQLDCTIETPRQLDEVVIDSSVLLRRSPGRYSFNVVIRNRSANAVAMPAIELTLTDIQDRVLVRRVLLPAEWPRTADALDAGAEWSLQFDLALDHASDQVMTGYRALLFYP